MAMLPTDPTDAGARSATGPHDAVAIARRLTQFSLPPHLRAAAAVHLATPIGTVGGIHTQIADGQWTWRGHAVAAPATHRPDALATAAVALATAGWHSHDRALVLDGPCLKPVRSGAYVMLAGTFCYQAPEILVAPSIPDPVATGVAWLAVRGSDGPTGAVVLDGVVHLVAGDDRAVVIHSTTGAPVIDPVPQYDTRTVQQLLEQLLDIESFEAATIGSRLTNTVDVDYVGLVHTVSGSYEVIVPTTIGNGLVLGAPHGASIPPITDWYQSGGATTWREVDGYTPVEPARFEPGWIARHDASGVYVIVREHIEY